MSYYWLLAPFALYAAYIAIRTALQASILLWRVAMITAVDVAEKMSRAIVTGVIESATIALFYAGRGVSIAFEPVSRRAKAARDAKDQQDQQTSWEELTKKPDNEVVLARKVLGLPEGYSDAELHWRYRNLAKRVAESSGGTEWLLQQVNWANTVLKGKL
jgi:hypothetical protein